MTRQEFRDAMEQDAEEARNKVFAIQREIERLNKELEYWTRQAEAARTVATRLTMECAKDSA